MRMGLRFGWRPLISDHPLAFTELDFTPALKLIVGHERGFVK
jgi:hypothetical protein